MKFPCCRLPLLPKMTLGISAAVNSCSDPVTRAICWFLALSSLRKAPAHCILILLITLDANHHPKPRLQRRVCGTLGPPVQPVFKILNLDDMGDFGIPDLHGDGGKSFSDVANPLVTVDRGESLGNCFVKSLGRHVERMRGAVQIVDNDGAGFEGHKSIHHIRYLFAHRR